MKRRVFIPLISILAAILAFAGQGLVWAPQVKAQQRAAPQNAQVAPVKPGGDLGSLNERIARLEQRIFDMQSVIATLQSFVRAGAGAAAPGGLAAAGAPPAGAGAGGAPSEVTIRVLALETQIRAITGQMEQITEKLNQMAARTGAGAAPMQPGRQLGGAPNVAPPQPPVPGQPGQFTTSAPPAPQFGTTTTAPAPTNPFERAMQGKAPRPAAPQAPPAQRQSAQLPAFPNLSASGGGGARGIYDASYQNFLRNDLPAAEQGFRSFVETYPDDPLASNAYYWLGRTHFERRKFELAAKAFLAGYKKDKNSAIAPDALLHLGMSLTQLGENEAACSTLGAIAKQFPDAPGKLKQDAATALKRARC